ncbi:hypothetical protein [Agromyces fucosus]|uniref:hypothetical protein n=1 Tax=Agromyces fucosus TaxID=41985 RepID=UPI00100ED693|nr:hypothetical protein [Agromyces fucosus]
MVEKPLAHRRFERNEEVLDAETLQHLGERLHQRGEAAYRRASRPMGDASTVDVPAGIARARHGHVHAYVVPVEHPQPSGPDTTEASQPAPVCDSRDHVVRCVGRPVHTLPDANDLSAEHGHFQGVLIDADRGELGCPGHAAEIGAPSAHLDRMELHTPMVRDRPPGGRCDHRVSGASTLKRPCRG